jgi:hypothetical protein
MSGKQRMPSNTELSASTAIVANDDCISTEIDGESVILHMGQGKYYGFNQVGTHVWSAVQEPHTLDELFRSVSESYDVTQERCEADVRELVSELLELGLVHIVD